MNLPPAPAAYDPEDQSQVRRTIAAADGKNVKIGGHFDIQSPNGKWWRPSIDNTGAVTWTALP